MQEKKIENKVRGTTKRLHMDYEQTKDWHKVLTAQDYTDLQLMDHIVDI